MTKRRLVKCKSCGELVFWVISTRGATIPINQQQSVDGNIRIVDGTALVGTKGSGPYVSHFATCPHANKHRRAR